MSVRSAIAVSADDWLYKLVFTLRIGPEMTDLTTTTTTTTTNFIRQKYKIKANRKQSN